MKIKKETLKKIVREELSKTLNELVPIRQNPDGSWYTIDDPNNPSLYPDGPPTGEDPEVGVMGKIVKGFSNIVSIEPLQGNDPDVEDIATRGFSRSHKHYKVTLPGGIKYLLAKHFADHDNNMPEKASLEALGRAPEIPKPIQLAVNKLVLKALSKQEPIRRPVNESIDVATVENLEVAIAEAYDEMMTPTAQDQVYADTGEPVSKEPEVMHQKAVDMLMSIVRDVTSHYQQHLQEKKLTKPEEKEKEKIVKGMKKDKSDFKKRYGKDAESVMYATATKLAKEKANESNLIDKNMLKKIVQESIKEVKEGRKKIVWRKLKRGHWGRVADNSREGDVVVHENDPIMDMSYAERQQELENTPSNA